ncbi:MAG: SCO family protein [Pseudomonadales bacterium]|nr:SCO family protein [Pseudomonadales bacterium]
MRNTLLWTLGFIVLILLLFVASFLGSRPLSDEQLRELGYYELPQSVPLEPFSLTDHRGRPVGLESLEGRWSLLFFGFTYCPDICPTTLSVLNRAVRQMEQDPRVIMVSVDPERDTVDKIADYVPNFNPDFIGYTGSFDETVNLAEQMNIAFGKVPGEEPGSYLVEHSAAVVVVDPQARYVGFIKPPHQAENIVAIMSAIR